MFMVAGNAGIVFLVEKVFEKRHVTEESVTLKYINGSDRVFY